MVIGKEANIFKLVVLEIRETYLNYVVSEIDRSDSKYKNKVFLTKSDLFYLNVRQPYAPLGGEGEVKVNRIDL